MNNTRGVGPSPEHADHGTDSTGGRTYYQRNGVCVTDQYLVAEGRRYEIARLRTVWTTRGPHDPVAMSAAVVSAVVVLAVTVGHPGGTGVWGWAAVLAVASIALGLAVAVGKSHGRHYELWAEYNGADLRILESASSEVYGQICRALIRAREARFSGPLARTAARMAAAKPRRGRSGRNAATGRFAGGTGATTDSAGPKLLHRFASSNTSR